MIFRIWLSAFLVLGGSASLSAQLSQDARFEILRTVLAEQAAARIGLPLGNDGVEMTDAGVIDQGKLDKQLEKEGQSIQIGQVVTLTNISFDDNRIEVELDGGGKTKKSFWERIEVGIGSSTTPVGGDDSKQAKGSKIVLRFAQKVPPDLTPDQLRQLLDPILDFNKSNFLKTGIEALPPEFQEAVKAKEARIGMDRSTVIMALGRPDNKVRETVDGMEKEDWIYFGRGLRATFVTFEGDVVVRIREY
jgi:hypothetical protein